MTYKKLKRYTLREFPDDIKAKEYDSDREHPTVEQLFLREAIRALTPKQKVIWEYYNFDKYTLDKIGLKMGISHQAVHSHIRAAERKMIQFCKENQGVYNILKENYANKD